MIQEKSFPMVTLTQIRNFITLAEELHFAKAAEKLNISQSALSGEIRKLERILQCQLFDRSDRWNIHLTNSGTAYYRKLKILPVLLEEARMDALKAARGESGVLSVAVNQTLYNHINMSLIFRKMFARYPDVRLKILDCASDVASEALLEGSCDVAFLSTNMLLENTLRQLQFEEMFRTPLALVIPKNHPLASKRKLSVGDFKECSFIMPPASESMALREKLERFFIEQGKFTPHVVQEARGLLATQHLVAAGLGIGILPESMFNVFPDYIVYRKAPFPMERTVVAAWNGNNTSQILRNFLKLLKEIRQEGLLLLKQKEKN
jgi:DNA-binding transcriptional LysR family regulator